MLLLLLLYLWFLIPFLLSLVNVTQGSEKTLGSGHVLGHRLAPRMLNRRLIMLKHYTLYISKVIIKKRLGSV